jgi:ergothioneine biosynthesis protein EgtB
VRRATEALAAALGAEDCQAQSMPDASPTKWHLAHTTWFFETFVLAVHRRGYTALHPEHGYLYNSYYEAIGERVPRAERGRITRPSLDEVREYRAHVDRQLLDWLSGASAAELAAAAPVIETGLHHEQQHQELILTDVKHLLSLNPLKPVYRKPLAQARAAARDPGRRWISFPGGVVSIGQVPSAGFHFDNEAPRHERLLRPFRLASRLTTCREYLEFIADGGYATASLWLSDGWATVQARRWCAPLYWEEREGAWQQFTLAGLRPIDPDEPVTHVSYYEADAFARWAGARLAGEDEWECAAHGSPDGGNFVESGALHPLPAPDADGLQQMLGDTWEWTQSPYTPYPGYRPPAGALGEYNGKFMCNQLVLRGGSCATPASHIRASYRNFFYPDARWQFSGIRLAQDA